MPANRPPALFLGATIAILAPASAPRDLARIDAGKAVLAERYGLRFIDYPIAPVGYLSHTDAARAQAFNAAVANPDVDALFCVRGGYGTLRILDAIEYEAAQAHPKLLVGYSDITALQLALYRNAGWTSVSGPMVAVEWPAPDEPSAAQFWQLATGHGTGPLVGPYGETLEPVRSGSAEGVLLGGNLSLVAKLIGTPYLPELTGAILFLEEVGEEPYRLDGLFAHLKLSGLFDALGGLVLGQFTGDTKPSTTPGLTTQDVIAHYTADLGIPVARNLAYGHVAIKNAIPVGVRARLDVTTSVAELTLLGSPVRAAPV
ncbi:MAG: LD-carboxypeptidase [Bacteroidota bacterium]